MGSHIDGFHHRLPIVAEEEQCHLCRHRQPLESCPLLSSEGLHFSSSVGGFVLCTAFPRRSDLIEAVFSPPGSRRRFKRRFVRQCCSVPLITLRPVGRLSV